MTDAAAEPVRPQNRPRLIIAWVLVGAPLAYGIYNIVKATLPLFGG